MVVSNVFQIMGRIIDIRYVVLVMAYAIKFILDIYDIE